MSHKAGRMWAHHFVDDEIRVPLIDTNGSGSLDGFPIHVLLRREAFIASDVTSHTCSESACQSQLLDIETYTRLQPALRLATQLIEIGTPFLQRVAHAPLIQAYHDAPISLSLLSHTSPSVSTTTWQNELNHIAETYRIHTCQSSLVHTHTDPQATDSPQRRVLDTNISDESGTSLFYGCTIPAIVPATLFHPSTIQIRSALREELIFELSRPHWYSHPYPRRCAVFTTIAITLFHEFVHAMWFYRFLPQRMEQLQRDGWCEVLDEPLADTNDMVQQNELGVVAEYEILGCEIMMAGGAGAGARFDGREGLEVFWHDGFWRIAEAAVLGLFEERTWEREGSGNLRKTVDLWFLKEREGSMRDSGKSSW